MSETTAASHPYGQAVSVEKVQASDQDFKAALAYLLPQLSSSAAVPTDQQLGAILNSNNISVFAAKLKVTEAGGTKIVGMITVGYLNLITGKIALIEDVVVDDSARNRGVGKALVAAAISESLEYNVKHVELTSRPQRAAANRLYEKMGFTQRETNVWRYRNNFY